MYILDTHHRPLSLTITITHHPPPPPSSLYNDSWTGTSPSGATGSSVRKLLLEEDTAVRAALVVYFEKFHSDIQAL